MRFLLNFIMLCLWALWLGGTLAMFIFAPYFFHSLDWNIAKPAANAMFVVFAKYQLCLAGALLLATGLQIITSPNKPILLFLLTVIAAGGLAVMTSLGFMPLMNSLRAQGKSDLPAFQRLHHKSVVAMTTQAGVLFLAGGLLIVTVTRPVAVSRSLPS